MSRLLTMCLFSVMFFCSIAEAKYNNPEGAGKSRRITNRYFNMLNETKDGELTLEQYKKREITREDRRNERRDKKDGVYLTDEEKFKAMDTDADGKVNPEEMSEYIKKLRENGRNFY